jgi:preprotein translocase subunit SecA
VFNVEVQVQPQEAAAGPNWGLGSNSTATRNLNTSGGQGLAGRDAIAAAAGAAVPPRGGPGGVTPQVSASEAGQMAAEVVEAPVPVETRRLDDTEKIGRNDPCWCGSGKKFKKCHGA